MQWFFHWNMNAPVVLHCHNGATMLHRSDYELPALKIAKFLIFSNQVKVWHHLQFKVPSPKCTSAQGCLTSLISIYSYSHTFKRIRTEEVETTLCDSLYIITNFPLVLYRSIKNQLLVNFPHHEIFFDTAQKGFQDIL